MVRLLGAFALAARRGRRRRPMPFGVMIGSERAGVFVHGVVEDLVLEKSENSYLFKLLGGGYFLLGLPVSLMSFRVLLFPDLPFPLSSSISADSIVKWAPPPTGSFKINSDAAVRVNNQLIGVGIVVRDSCGRVCASSVNRINACFSPSVAEAIAIRNGLRLAGDTGEA
ncbi:hypothetical protein EZV62_009202 [Acer yangbiense]|uniref:RNase H type-1 domain-containing protein n=1 Tax=Acer yangbiense TaxID=1000413 RepID=A0A5C7IF08_9ROSI|nr:hypothetical protein EZV62_009202 [Acer yangbiense]